MTDLGNNDLTVSCHFCGFENPDGFRYCGNCGRALENNLPKIPPFVSSPLYHPSQILSEQEFIQFEAAARDAVGEKRKIVVLFADICDYTVLSQQVDAEEVFALINRYLGALIEQVYEYGGVVDKFTGDGLMALFGAPVAHENDAERAVFATLGMQDSIRRLNNDISAENGVDIRVRFGLHYGTVVFGQVGINLGQSLNVMDYTAIGDTVNLASRLQSAAEPGYTLVSKTVFEQTEPFFDFEKRPPLTLKGYQTPILNYKVIGHKAQRGNVRGLGHHHSPLVGRETEMALIGGILDNLVTEKMGQILLVTGEAGLGKSRLTSELKARALEQNVLMLEGESLSYRQSVSYWLFRQILFGYFRFQDQDSQIKRQYKIRHSLRDLNPDLEHLAPILELALSVPPSDAEAARRLKLLDAEQLRQQTFVAIHDLFYAEAKRRPVILILEDLHWADQLSLDLIKFLSDIITQAPLLLFCIARPKEGGAAQTITEHAQTYFPEHFTTTQLRPLSSNQSQELLSALLSEPNLPVDLEKSIFLRAEGNPFYLEEMIRMLIDQGVIHQVGSHWKTQVGASFDQFDVPDSLQGLVMARFDRLPGDLKYLLQVASVIGFRFSTRVLSMVTPHAQLADQLGRLQALDFVIRQPDDSNLTYSFRHAITSETIYQSILRRQRAKIHGCVAQAIEKLYRNRLAEHVESLATHYTKSAHQDRALYYLIRSAKKAARSFANTEAMNYYEHAHDLFGRVDSTPSQQLEVLEGSGDVMAFIGEYDSAKLRYQQAIQLCQHWKRSKNAHLTGALFRKIADTSIKQGDYDEALKYLAVALRQVKVGTGLLLHLEKARICSDTGWVYLRRGELEHAKSWFERGLGLIDLEKHRDIASSLYNRLAGLYFQADDRTEAAKWLGESLRIQQELGDLAGMARSHNNLGVMAARQADFVQARKNLARSLELRSQIGDTEGVLSINLNLGAVLITLGDLDEADRALGQALDIAKRIGHSFYEGMTLLNLGRLGIYREEWEQAIEHLNLSAKILQSIGAQDDLIDASYFLGEAWMGKGVLDQAEHWGNEALELTSQLGSRALAKSFQKGRSQRLMGAIARKRKDWTRAERLLKESVAIYRATENRFEQGKSYFELALLARSMDDQAKFTEYMNRAREIFDDLGARLESEKVERLFRDLASEK